MSQAQYLIEDQSGISFLSDINSILKAIQTVNSGATPPTDTKAGMWWGDTSKSTTYYLKMRNHTNDGWVSLYAYDVATKTINALTNDTVKITGNQTIAGVKTFSSSPIVPTPTTNMQPTAARSTNITVTVGSGGDYATINQALEYLSGFYPLYKSSGVTATINLLSGFVMAEQVLVRGLDLGWITIVGEDAETIITHTALTTAFYSSYPAFGVDKGGTSPVIGQLFRFNVEKVGGEKHGLVTLGAGSSADVLSGKGFIGAGTHGIFAKRGSTINAYGANCSNAGAVGIFALDGSTINARSANCSNAGTVGIYADTASTINAYEAIIQNQTTGTARIIVEYGSTIEAAGINTTGGTVPVFNQAVNTLTQNGIIYQ